MSDDRSVSCSNCGISLDDDPSGSIESRQPCPNCGSLARTINVVVGGAVDLRGRGSLEVGGRSAWSSPVTATTLPAPVTSIGLEATHTAQIKLVPMHDGTWLVEVTATNGYIKTGMGDSPADALLDLIAYMLPPDDPEFPTD
jgi:hypothetical protein